MIEFMQEKVGPIAGKLANNRYLVAIRDAFMLAAPLTMFGSFLVIILNFPGLSSKFPTLGENLGMWFGHSIDATMGILAVFVAFGVGYYITKSRGVEAIYGGAISLASFMIVTPFFDTGEAWPANTGIHIYMLGAQGMFVAIITGIIASEVYSFITNKNIIIKMPEQVPPTVAKSFAALIPGIGALLTVNLIGIIFTYSKAGNLHSFIYHIIQVPLEHLGATLPATIVVIFFAQFFFFFGLHGQILVNSVMEPIWTSLSLANINGAENVVTKAFMDTFTVGLGGTGATLPLIIIILLIAKDPAKRKIAKLSLAPGLFNVNEPVIFGLPIVLNFKMLIPWLIAPIVSVTIAYLAMSLGLVPVTTGAQVPWTIPVLISGFLATSSWQGSVLQLVQMVVVGLIWIPFIKFGDLEQVSLEEETRENSLSNNSTNNENQTEVTKAEAEIQAELKENEKLKRILLVCASGMSTSLLVTKMSKEAEKRGLNTVIEAKGNSNLEQYKGEWDVCLLGPQVSYAKSGVQEVFSDIKVEVIPMDIYGKGDGEAALDLALKLIP